MVLPGCHKSMAFGSDTSSSLETVPLNSVLLEQNAPATNLIFSIRGGSVDEVLSKIKIWKIWPFVITSFSKWPPNTHFQRGLCSFISFKYDEKLVWVYFVHKVTHTMVRAHHDELWEEAVQVQYCTPLFTLEHTIAIHCWLRKVLKLSLLVTAGRRWTACPPTIQPVWRFVTGSFIRAK